MNEMEGPVCLSGTGDTAYSSHAGKEHGSSSAVIKVNAFLFPVIVPEAICVMSLIVASDECVGAGSS